MKIQDWKISTDDCKTEMLQKATQSGKLHHPFYYDMSRIIYDGDAKLC